MLIPANILRLMSQSDQKKYAPEQALGTESQEQAKFAKYLKSQWAAGFLEYDWQRTDKRATARRGRPDFFIFLGGAQTLAIEFKAPEGRLSIEQAVYLKTLARLGYSALIARSCAEAIGYVESRR